MPSDIKGWIQNGKREVQWLHTHLGGYVHNRRKYYKVSYKDGQGLKVVFHDLGFIREFGCQLYKAI